MIRRKALGFFKRPKRVFVLFLLFLSTAKLQAQEVKQLSLEEAISLTISHDLQLKQDTAQIRILQARLNQNRKSLLPDVGVNLNYTRISDNITPFTVVFPTGKVTLNPQILNQSYNSLQLKQLIWSGGKSNYGIQISVKELEAAKSDLEKSRADAVYNISALWYNLYVLKTSQKIIEANIKSLLQSQQDVLNFVKQGLALDNDALKIDLAITNLQSDLIDISNSITAQNFNLRIITGLPGNTVLELPELNEANPSIDNDMATYIASALDSRAELKTVRAYKDITTLGLKISKLNSMPTVSAIASGNYNLPEQRVFPNQNQFTPTWFAGVNINWSISNFYKNPQQTNESRQTVMKANALYSQTQERIMMEVNTAYTEYLQATQKMVNAKKALEQATENFRVEQNKLRAATITSTDFLDANTRLLQARLNLNAVRANAQLAVRKLNKASGK